MVRPEPPLDAEGTVSCPGALQPRDWEEEGRESSDDKHPESSSSGANPQHVTAGLGYRPRFLTAPCSSPSLSTHSMSLDMVPVYQ